MKWHKRRPSERAEIIEQTFFTLNWLSDKIEDYVDDCVGWEDIGDIIQSFYERAATLKVRLVSSGDKERIAELEEIIQWVDALLEEHNNKR